MRAAADLHLSRVTQQWVLEALAHLRADAEEHGGPTVLCGDLLDVAETVPSSAFLAFHRAVRGWPDLFILAGNHDQLSRDSGRTMLSLLADADVTVVTDTHVTDFGAMLAYRHPSTFRARCEALAPRPLVFAHQGFRGAYMNAMVRDRDGVNPTDTPAESVVVTGHYHLPHSIGNIIYCGSPFQLSFAEEGQTKSFLRWEPGEAWPTRVPFRTSAPTHYTVRWHPDAGPPEPPDAVQPHDKVRVVTTVDRNTARKAAGQLKQAGLEGAAVVTSSLDDLAVTVEAGAEAPVAVWKYLDALYLADPRRPASDAVVEAAEQEGLWIG